METNKIYKRNCEENLNEKQYGQVDAIIHFDVSSYISFYINQHVMLSVICSLNLVTFVSSDF